MKTCHVCGALVDDRELTCPECGATVVKHSGGMTLRIEEPVKKKANPMGTSIGTGSGLTDILRSENDDYESVDDEFFGSLPTSFGKEYVDTSVKKKSDNGKVFKTVFKILILAAVAYGVYFLVTNVFMKGDTIDSYEKALDCYVESINGGFVDDLEVIIPPYVGDTEEKARKIIADKAYDNISKYDVITVDQMDSSEIVSLQDEIKLNSTKTANIKAACVAEVRFFGTTLSAGGSRVESNSTQDMIFIQIRDNWYIYVE